METIGNVGKSQLFFILVNPKQFLEIPMKISDNSRSFFFKKTHNYPPKQCIPKHDKTVFSAEGKRNHLRQVFMWFLM